MTQQRRTIISGQSATTSFKPDPAVALHEWLAAQASENELKWLLLHADEGVVWGEQRENTLALSTNGALHWNSLHHARLFSEHGELFVWRGPQGWQARLIQDTAGEAAQWVEEQQQLWGNRPIANANNEAGFTAITEGSQGISHAPPIGDNIPSERLRACLLIRHYLGEDDAGVARVAYSRVVKLLKPGEK